MALGDEVAVTNGASDPKEEPNDPVNALIEESSEPSSNTSSEEQSLTEETEVINEPELSGGSKAEEVSEKEDADGVESVPEEEEEEEDLIDPMDGIREECKAGSEAVKMAQILEECQNRVNSRSNTEETCHEEMIDYVHAVDHCMAKSVFSKLK